MLAPFSLSLSISLKPHSHAILRAYKDGFIGSPLAHLSVMHSVGSKAHSVRQKPSFRLITGLQHRADQEGENSTFDFLC